ncbi:hypothetical protein HAX54_037381, partial [Datura stramonium]|nr:hypothetical protein [Datura stramonium]
MVIHSGQVKSDSAISSNAMRLPPSIQRPVVVDGFRFRAQKELGKMIDEKLAELDLKPLNLASEFSDDIQDSSKDHKEVISSELNKLKKIGSRYGGKYADKPHMNTHYYPRPTPQDVLVEERDWNQTNTSYE